ncbi:hypothetical protein CBR_g27919 [Chara braunii]|uniref:Uncharacterized protein n=1 Tax=Chara braunii TaxID=69332 RepID=A0A388L932_CHABU|nr:hypothetical protein CBR_g27919 [Chara braunii]|eukprot:GBG78693.1 hypothetical protein CBR_g27919 [Chara braunii]
MEKMEAAAGRYGVLAGYGDGLWRRSYKKKKKKKKKKEKKHKKMGGRGGGDKRKEKKMRGRRRNREEEEEEEEEKEWQLGFRRRWRGMAARYAVRKIIKEKKPKSIHAIEVQEFSLGSSPPELGLHRTYWATDNSGMTSMYAGFKWDTNEMSIMLAAKLAGPFKGKVVRILINSIYVRGQVRIMPVLDGQGVLYAFDEVPEVKLGMEVGAANQMLPFTELPFIASWLVAAEDWSYDQYEVSATVPSPKCRHEASVTVANYVFRYIVAADPAGVQEACQLGSCGVVFAREKARILTQMVHNREDAVVSEAVVGEWSDDIHGNGETGFLRDRHRAQLAVGIAVARFASSANFARVAIPRDVGDEVGPSEPLSKPCNSAVDSEMAGESRIMILAEEASPKTAVAWDT